MVASGLIAFNDLTTAPGNFIVAIGWRYRSPTEKFPLNIVENIICYQCLAGAPEEIRTPDPQIRSLVLTVAQVSTDLRTLSEEL